MIFINVREFRIKPSFVWERLGDGQEVVLTSNGKPIAIMTSTNGDKLEADIKAIRKARIQPVIERMRKQAKAKGINKLSPKDIENIIAETRKER